LAGIQGSPASAWVASVAKAARAFLLYDPGNAVIRQFLADYAERSKQALASGALVLDLAPYEISGSGVVVYRERDRERSLAFRLFRDGVRKITVEPTVSWEELLLFLQILAVRFSGIQQQEEDVVTLLWKAEFRGISFQVVQGFASEDEEPGAGYGGGSGAGGASGGASGATGTGATGTEQGAAAAGSGGRTGSGAGGNQSDGSTEVAKELERAASAAAALGGEALRAEPPPHWDEPLPRYPQPVAIAHRPMAPEAFKDLRAEVAPEALPAAAVAAVRYLVAEAARSNESKIDPILSEFVKDVRLFLLGEGELVGVMELAEMVGRLQGGAGAETDLLHELGDPAAVETILRAVPDDVSSPPAKVAPVLALIRLDALLDLLAAEKRPARRMLLLGLARARLPADGDLLLARLPSLDPAMGLELLTTFADRDPERAARAAGPLLAHPVPDVRLAALKVLEGSEGEMPAGPLLKLLRTADDEGTRIRVLQLLGKRGEPAAFEGIERWAEDQRDLALTVAEALGCALAQLAPIPASRTIARWLRPEKGVFKALRESSQHRALTWAAVAGLGVLPGTAAQQQLETVAQDAGGDLRRHCLAALAKRRRHGAPHG
jgi:hypothetical protein